MQPNYPKKGVLDQINEPPHYAELTAESVIKALYQLFLKREPTEEELQKELDKIKLTDLSN